MSTASVTPSGFSCFLLSPGPMKFHHQSLSYINHHTLYCLLRFLTPLYGVSLFFIAVCMYLAHDKCSKHHFFTFYCENFKHTQKQRWRFNESFGLLPALTTLSCHSCFTSTILVFLFRVVGFPQMPCNSRWTTPTYEWRAILLPAESWVGFLCSCVGFLRSHVGLFIQRLTVPSVGGVIFVSEEVNRVSPSASPSGVWVRSR